MSDLTDRADSRLNQARADRLKGGIRAVNDPTPRPAVYLGEQGDRSLMQRLGEGITPSGILQTNGGIPANSLVEMHGNSVDAMPRVKRQPKPQNKAPSTKVKIGYVYSKTVNGATGLFCASPTSGGGNVGGTNFGSVYASYSATSSTGFADSSPRTFIGGANMQPYVTNQSLDETTIVFTSQYGSTVRRQVVSQQTLQYGNGSIVIYNRTDYTFPSHPDLNFWSQVERPYDLVSPPPDASPDQSHSSEFWYMGDKAKTSIKLKTLASNQPLEAKPYIIHKSASLSYVILKYGNASNDGGSSSDWCKLSLFEVIGSTDLAIAETVYSWGQEYSLQENLKSLKSAFYAIAGTKTKLANLNLDTLITNGLLDARLKCFTHRNLTNLKQSLLNVYLIDPITGENSPLGDLAGDAVYDYGAIASNLVSLEAIRVNLRLFTLKANPTYTGSTEDCLTNPTYKLTEKASGKIKLAKVIGLGSNDASIKILTLNAGQI